MDVAKFLRTLFLQNNSGRLFLHSYEVLVKCSTSIVEVRLDLGGRLGPAGGEHLGIIVKLLA